MRMRRPALPDGLSRRLSAREVARLFGVGGPRQPSRGHRAHASQTLPSHETQSELDRDEGVPGPLGPAFDGLDTQSERHDGHG